MSTKLLTRNGGDLPTVFDDFFKPWNQWFDTGTNLLNRVSTVPGVNIIESADDFKLTFAVPGMKKDDFHINVEGNTLTVSSEKEESKEYGENRHTRREYNYTSFTRSFNLPEDVKVDHIEATYTDGILKLTLPKKEEAKRVSAKNITVK